MNSCLVIVYGTYIYMCILYAETADGPFIFHYKLSWVLHFIYQLVSYSALYFYTSQFMFICHEVSYIFLYFIDTMKAS